MDAYRFLRGVFGPSRALAKEEIPEVSSVYRIVEPLVRKDREARAREGEEALLLLLLAYEERLGQEDVDQIAFSTSAADRERRIEEETTALIAALLEVGAARLRPAISASVASGAQQLMRDGAKSAGALLQEPSPRRGTLAALDLTLALRGRLLSRAESLRDPIRGYLTSKSLRQALRSPGSAPGAAELGDRWREAVRTTLGLPWSRWGPQTVDAWAYRWHNLGRFWGGEQEGVRRWIAVNPRDERTTLFCRWVHGKVVSASRIRRQIQDYLSAVAEGDQESAQAAWPLEEPQGSRVEFRARLSRRGLPPYHFRCRTVVVPG